MKLTITALMEEYSLTMSELSRKYNIPYRTLQEWNAGRREPPDYVLELLKFRLEHENE